MVCHDAPASVPLLLDPPSPSWARHDLERAAAHRHTLQAIVEHVQPRWLIHGHYHVEHETAVTTPWGLLSTAGLNREGAARNYRVLDVRQMAFVPEVVA